MMTAQQISNMKNQLKIGRHIVESRVCGLLRNWMVYARDDPMKKKSGHLNLKTEPNLLAFRIFSLASNTELNVYIPQWIAQSPTTI